MSFSFSGKSTPGFGTGVVEEIVREGDAEWTEWYVDAKTGPPAKLVNQRPADDRPCH